MRQTLLFLPFWVGESGTRDGGGRGRGGGGGGGEGCGGEATAGTHHNYESPFYVVPFPSSSISLSHCQYGFH